jgi:hypothetical protein
MSEWRPEITETEDRSGFEGPLLADQLVEPSKAVDVRSPSSLRPFIKSMRRGEE